MPLSKKDRDFLETHRAAAMITIRPDGTPHAVRVGVALVDGKLWSSGRQDRVRTGHLRSDPRCTLFIWEQGYGSLTLETHVTILDGPDVPEFSVRLFQTMQAAMEPAPQPGNLMWGGEERSSEEFRKIMIEEHRLIYEFEVGRTYGLV